MNETENKEFDKEINDDELEISLEELEHREKIKKEFLARSKDLVIVDGQVSIVTKH